MPSIRDIEVSVLLNHLHNSSGGRLDKLPVQLQFNLIGHS
jgi:hypothetical protein